jgi:hypothetical protein
MQRGLRRVGLAGTVVLALGVMALVPTTAGASPRMHSCGYRENTGAKASLNVSCRTAWRVHDHADAAHGCSAGRTCHVFGWRCVDRRTGFYTTRMTCTKRDPRRRIVGNSSA